MSLRGSRAHSAKTAFFFQFICVTGSNAAAQQMPADKTLLCTADKKEDMQHPAANTEINSEDRQIMQNTLSCNHTGSQFLTIL